MVFSQGSFLVVSMVIEMLSLEGSGEGLVYGLMSTAVISPPACCNKASLDGCKSERWAYQKVSSSQNWLSNWIYPFDYLEQKDEAGGDEGYQSL